MVSNGVHANFLPVDVRVWVCQRLDDLWRDNQALLDDQNTGVVVVDTRVVRARGDRHKVVREPLDSIWAD